MSEGRRRSRGLTALLVAGVVLSLPLAAILILLVAMNGIVRRTVETLGTDAMGVPVRLEKAQVSLSGGARLTGFVVGNPIPFDEIRALRLDRCEVGTRLGALLGNPVQIRDLVLVHPEITLEVRGRKTNWGVLIRNLSDSIEAGRASPSRKKEDPESSGKTTFIIRRVKIIDPVVRVRLPVLGNPVTIHLNDIQLDRVGTSPGSASTLELVLTAIYQALFEAEPKGAEGIPAEVRGVLKDEFAELAGALGDLLLE